MIQQRQYFLISLLYSLVSEQLLYIIIKLPNDQMDRLFGKELSNLLEPSLHINRQKNSSRISSKSTRISAPDENCKNVNKKAEKSSTSAQYDIKPAKIHQPSEVSLKEEGKQIKNVQLVLQYFDECFEFMLHQESKNYNLCNYMDSQPDIDDKMRAILLQWIVELHQKLKMFPETLYTATMIIDKYLAKKHVKKETLQLVGTAAFFIAAKYEETYQIPDLDDLVYFAAKAFSKSDIIKMEADIIETLDFDLIMTTSYKFLEPLSKICNMDMKNFYLAQYVLELSLLNIKFLKYKPSLLASSAIYLINKIRKRTQAWSDLMIAATGYQEKDLKTSARQLCYLLQKVDDSLNTKSLKKKFSTPQYNKVAEIKLERKRQ